MTRYACVLAAVLLFAGVYSSSAQEPADTIAALNAQIVKLAEGRKNVTVLDLYALLAKSDGSPDLQYFKPDKLHLAAPGYAKWVEALTPIFSKLDLQ